MGEWIILPYDESPVARASLRRAAQAVRSSECRYRGVLAATAGIDPTALDALAATAAAIAGPDVRVEMCLLPPGEPLAAFAALRDAFPNATLAVPIGARGVAGWYVRACRERDDAHATMLFFIDDKELARFRRAAARRRGPWGALAAAARAVCRPRIPAWRSVRAIEPTAGVELGVAQAETHPSERAGLSRTGN